MPAHLGQGLVGASLLAFAFLGCGGGGDPERRSRVDDDHQIQDPNSGGSSGNDIIADGGDGAGVELGGAPGQGGDPKPQNLGSEESCDGVDDNDNGIVDDVDVGKDGLCDCLAIGLLGEAANWGGDTNAFMDWLTERSSITPVRIAPGTAISADTFADLDVVILENLAQKGYSGGYSAGEISAFGDWVESGGGVVGLTGYSANDQDVDATNQLLDPLGVSYAAIGLGSGLFPGTDKAITVDGFIKHPTTEGVEAIGIYYGYPVAGDGKVVIEQDGSDLAIAKDQIGGENGGKVFLWGDEWITYTPLWVDKEKYPDFTVARFWLSVIKWLTPAQDCQVEIPPTIR
jgi:hypothetical protein